MKLALGLLIATQLLTMPAVAVNTVVYNDMGNDAYYGEEYEEPTRQEQFKWYYRMYNGHEQKRLWSITYAYWVTDWMDV
jgi:hypothetical protein